MYSTLPYSENVPANRLNIRRGWSHLQIVAAFQLGEIFNTRTQVYAAEKSLPAETWSYIRIDIVRNITEPKLLSN